MGKWLYRWWLVSWPVQMIHNISRRLTDDFFREFDPFGDYEIRAKDAAEAISQGGAGSITKI